jgi:hypothetical protein
MDAKKRKEVYMDVVTACMICEGCEEASYEKQIEAWQFLIDNDLVNRLQGSYGRGARQLIERGICHERVR